MHEQIKWKFDLKREVSWLFRWKHRGCGGDTKLFGVYQGFLTFVLGIKK